MKRLRFLIAFIALGMQGLFASTNPDLAQEISNKMIVDLNKVELNEEVTDYVLVGIIVEDDRIKIVDREATNDSLLQAVQERLNEMQIKSEYEEGKTYYFRFTFERE